VTYLSYTPRPPLNQFVQCLWQVIDGQAVRKERILPSGTTELVVNLHCDEVKIDSRHNSSRPMNLRGMAISGPYSGVFTIDAMQHTAIMGVHFRPGGAFALLGVPSSELTDTHLDAVDLWGDGAVRELRDRLGATTGPQERFQIMNDALSRRLRSARRQHPVVQLALRCFGPNGTGVQVREVARSVGLSHRSLITIFTREVGLSPKVFCRILRFRYLYGLAQENGKLDWAQVALACGFFDQSHLSNEFRKLSGLSPTEYLRQLQASRNVLPGHIAML